MVRALRDVPALNGNWTEDECQPQVALVCFGRIVEAAWAENGLPGVCPVLTATLVADPRANDGRRGALFLDALSKCLQEPDRI